MADTDLVTIVVTDWVDSTAESSPAAIRRAVSRADAAALTR